MFNIKELKTNNITVEDTILIGGGSITYDGTDKYLQTDGDFKCDEINCEVINTSFIDPSGTDESIGSLTVYGNIVTGSDISCNNMSISGTSSFNDIQGTNMVFINKDEDTIIKYLIKDNNFIAVAYTPEVSEEGVEGTNHTVHSFIRLNSDGIVLWGSSIQLYADDLESYPHGSYINIESIHKY